MSRSRSLSERDQMIARPVASIETEASAPRTRHEPRRPHAASIPMGRCGEATPSRPRHRKEP